MNFETRRTIGLLGSTLLIIGSFGPAMSALAIGDISVFWNGTDLGAGAGTIFWGLVGAFGVAVESRFWLGLAGSIGFATTGVGLIETTRRIYARRVSAEANAVDDDSIAGVMGQVTAAALQLSWAWGVLFAGAALLLVAAFARGSEPRLSREARREIERVLRERAVAVEAFPSLKYRDGIAR